MKNPTNLKRNALSLVTVSLGMIVCFLSGIHSQAGIATTYFDNNPDTLLTTPFIGTGTLTYSGPDFGDGCYDWNSFVNLSLSLNIHGQTFTEAHLLTPSSEVNIEIRGNSFFFSNDNIAGSSESHGAAEFRIVTGEAYNHSFSAAPLIPLDSTLRPVYMAFVVPDASTVPDHFYGNYGVPTAVPEPSVYGMALGVICLGGAIVRRAYRRSK